MNTDKEYLNPSKTENIFNKLIEDVTEKQPYPENYYEVAAVLRIYRVE